MMTQNTNTDHDLLADVPLPDGVTAGPWRADANGLVRTLSDGRTQRGDGRTITHCVHCTVPVRVGQECEFCQTYVPPRATWRDVVSDLTPTQIAHLAEAEARAAAFPDPTERLHDLVEYARYLAEQNARDKAVFGDIPVPPDATAVYPCAKHDDGRHGREFVGTRRAIAGLYLSVEGTQFDDGAVCRRLHIGVDSTEGMEPEFDIHQVRQLISMLGQLASAIEQAQ